MLNMNYSETIKEYRKSLEKLKNEMPDYNIEAFKRDCYRAGNENPPGLIKRIIRKLTEKPVIATDTNYTEMDNKLRQIQSELEPIERSTMAIACQTNPMNKEMFTLWQEASGLWGTCYSLRLRIREEDCLL